MRWSFRMLGWEPLGKGSRSVGRPVTRWEDSILKFAAKQGFTWRRLAQERDEWHAREEEFAVFKG